jgi:HlyD family secretion protein
MRFLIKAVVVLAILAAAGVGLYAYANRAKEEPASFRTASVTRGDLAATINATGTVEPEEVVDVGAQVAGQINTFGKDTSGKQVDYGSVVDENTILAQIDDSLYAADVAQAQASMEQAAAAQDQANASVVRATADLGQMKAKLDQAQRDWDRARKLGAGEALAQSVFDGYKSAYDAANATVAVGQAAIVQANGAVVQAKAAVAQAQAFLRRAQRNLSYCTIKSPVKGVIIDRRVNIGQTVVSSLNAPSLFLIAKDLTHMQVWVSVNEADIGQIRPGQPVTFTVDAFPGRKFSGSVGKIRLNASMTSNVVTYTVEVLTDNSSGTLLPYLTANVQFEVARRTNVLKVPNAALRWSPQPTQVAREFRDRLADYQRRPDEKPSGNAEASAAPGVVWTLEGGLAKPIRVQAGLTDGSQTEVAGEGLAENLEIVLGEQPRAAAAAATSNPFTPKIFSKSGRDAGGASGTGTGGKK